MSNCSRTNTGTTTHEGSHLLNWFHTDHLGRPIVESVNDVLIHAYTEDDDIADAVAIVRGLVDRARAEVKADPKAYERGFAVSTDERAAIELAVSDACDYMATNGYADDESYPEDAALAQFLGDTGTIARECFAAIPGWFKATAGC